MANKIYSVSQINAHVKGLLESEPFLSYISVSGEVSNYKDSASGHLYFTLKDERCALSCVMFMGARNRGLKTALKNGMKVVVTGKVGVYEASGSYQLYASEITEEGVGDLFRQFEELKKKLEEMGMFDPSYKKPIPKYARVIGVVTSPDAAALRDIVNVTSRRNPYVQLILSPTLVQGKEAPASIVKALKKMDRCKPDIIILGRGGGSIEDLWAFNDEAVARAIFECETPVISAVGHETDFTIADFVSDRRAPTPSAAAELATFLYTDFAEFLRRSEILLSGRMEQRITLEKRRLQEEKLLLIGRMTGLVNEKALQLRRSESTLKGLHPGVLLEKRKQVIKEALLRMTNATDAKLVNAKNRLSVLAAKTDALSPLKKLTGGYGYISVNAEPVRSVSEVSVSDSVKIRLSDGEISAAVTETKKD